VPINGGSPLFAGFSQAKMKKQWDLQFQKFIVVLTLARCVSQWGATTATSIPAFAELAIYCDQLFVCRVEPI